MEGEGRNKERRKEGEEQLGRRKLRYEI